MPEVIIVGGGIGGLQLAAMLASDGREVHVLEREAHAGGRARPWVRDGFVVDDGVRLVRFGAASATARVFAHIDRQISFTPLGQSFVAFADGSVERFPARPSDIVSTGLLDERERAVALAMLTYWRGADPGRRIADTASDLLELVGVKQKLASYVGPLAERLRDTWHGSRLQSRLQLLDPMHTLEMSVAEWLEALELGPGLRQFFRLMCTSTLVCPELERASAGEMIACIKRVLATGTSVTYPAGGWNHVLATLTSVIEKQGAVKTGTPVARVLVKDGRAAGVELESGDTIQAERVVLDVPADRLFRLLDEAAVPGDFAARCRKLRPASAIAMDYALDRQITFDSGLWYLWEPVAYGMCVSNLCPGLVPPGKQLLSFVMPVAADDLGRAAELEMRLDAAVKGVFRGLEEAVQWRRARHLERFEGAEIGVDQHRGQRPKNRIPGVDNLYLLGDWSSAPGAAGDVVHESALRCYRAMNGEKEPAVRE
jgi:phytoene dehydrogenase-like protein